MQYATTPGAQGICPVSWHIPTNVEFQACSTAVQGDGNALKSTDQGASGGIGTNTSGFSALLVGCRGDNGTFLDLGNFIFFWSSTEFDAANVNCMFLNNSGSSINYIPNNKQWGFSVRCVKD